MPYFKHTKPQSCFFHFSFRATLFFPLINALVYADKIERATLGFCMYKIWQILKRFAGTFHRAQTLKLGGVHSLHAETYSLLLAWYSSRIWANFTSAHLTGIWDPIYAHNILSTLHNVVSRNVCKWVSVCVLLKSVPKSF